MAKNNGIQWFGTTANFKGLRCVECKELVADKAILVRTDSRGAVCAPCSYGRKNG